MPYRLFAAPVAGIVVGSVVIALVEMAGHALFPGPRAPARDDAAMRAYVSALPFGALAVVIAGWWTGTFVGAWSAEQVADRRPGLSAGIVCGVLLLATITNLATLPHPPWMAVLAPIGILAAGWLAMRLAARRASPG